MNAIYRHGTRKRSFPPRGNEKFNHPMSSRTTEPEDITCMHDNLGSKSLGAWPGFEPGACHNSGILLCYSKEGK